MKNKLLLPLVVLLSLLNVASIYAQNSWSTPIPTPSLLGEDMLFYFYNPGAGKYLTEGNDWGTRTSIGTQGLQIKVTSIEEGVYTLQDSSKAKSAWKYIFINGPLESFVDMENQGNNQFALTNIDGYNYRISGNGEVYNAREYPNCYLGWDGGSNTIVYPLLDITAEGAAAYKIDWQLIQPANYFIHQARIELYNTLVAADSTGVSTTVAGVTYNNSNSTVLEIKDATTQLLKAINDAFFASATVTNPVNITSRITNPNFDTTVNGWTSTTHVQNQALATNQNGDFTHPFYENWHPTPFTGKVSQKITEIPKGVYKLRAALFANNGGDLYLFANNDKIASTSAIPVFVELFTMLSTDTLEIGMMQDKAVNNWIGMDTYTLHYYGNNSESYKFLLNHIIAKVAELDDKIVGKPELNELETHLRSAQNVHNNSLATSEEIITAYNTLVKSIYSAHQSVKAYEQLYKSMKDAEDALNIYNNEELSDYYIDIYDSYYAVTLNTEECYVAIDKIKELILRAKNSSVQVGDNTALLTNPDFDNGVAGWTGVEVVNHSEVEVYAKTFNMYQVLRGIPNGKYTVKCQGFFRTQSNENAYQEYALGTADIRCMLYANDKMTAMTNVMSQGLSTPIVSGDDFQKPSGGYVPNGMQGARGYFDNGLYDTNEVSVIVTENILTLGIKLEDATGYNAYWMLADNFRLYYNGASNLVLAEEIDNLLVTANELVSKSMYKESKIELQTAIDNALQEQPMTAITNLNRAITTAKASTAAYAPLWNALEKAEIKIQNYTASARALATFSETYNRIYNDYTDGNYINDEIGDAIDELTTTVNIYLTADVQGSDENPADLTRMIVNADMTEGTTGWSSAGTVDNNHSLMEQYNKNFETYQTIKGLPNGLYKVTVQGFYRAGDLDIAESSRVSGTEILNAVLFANGNSEPIISIFDDSSTDRPLLGTIEEVNTWPYDSRTQYGYVPSTIQGARAHFDEGSYTQNELLVNVTDGKLVLGIKKSQLITGDWVAFTNFKLMYYGENSVNRIDSSFAIEAIPISVTYYNTNGSQQRGVIKGINLVRTTYSDGSVKVSKVIVK